MTKEQAIVILTKDFDIDQYQKYREIHHLFFNNWNTGCDCAKSDLYRKLKTYANNNNLFKRKEEMNAKQAKDNKSGKFIKEELQTVPVKQVETIPVVQNDNIFIRLVRLEVLSNEVDVERIKKAYQLIVNNDYPAHLNVMRRAIINYNNETI